MSLEEFKVIFYWEYFHRIISKINWFIFFNTFNLFLFFKKIKKEYLNICYLIFILILFKELLVGIWLKVV